MNFEAIIITGTRCSGKTTLVHELVKEDLSFALTKAITTRPKRSAEDELTYHHITEEEYDKKNFITKAQYGIYKYGIELSEVEKIVKSNKIPILIIAPDSCDQLIERNKNNFFISFFIDADDDILIDRLKTRSPSITEKELIAESKQREKDRQFANQCTYRINNSYSSFDISLCHLITKIWSFRKTGGLLPKQFISLLLKYDVLLKNSDESNISTSSYDLSLGDEYYYEGKIRNLSVKKPFMMIEPYDYAIVTSSEYANFSNDIAGRFDLKIGLFCQGIILSNGPQVDPGFRGKLFCLLFNTSNSPVVLKRGEHYATIEFNKLIEPTIGYSGSYQAKSSIINYLPSNTLRGGVNELKKEIEKLKNESIKIQTMILGIISLLLAILAIYKALN